MYVSSKGKTTQMKRMWPFISLWRLDRKPLVDGGRWAGRASLSVQPTPFCIFTNTNGTTPIITLSRAPWKVLALEGFDCLELHVLGKAPSRATSTCVFPCSLQKLYMRQKTWESLAQKLSICGASARGLFLALLKMSYFLWPRCKGC